jgi:hypothetical protein
MRGVDELSSAMLAIALAGVTLVAGQLYLEDRVAYVPPVPAARMDSAPQAEQATPVAHHPL